MDIVSRALALPIPLTKEYILSLPRIPKDYKIPKLKETLHKYFNNDIHLPFDIVGTCTREAKYELFQILGQLKLSYKWNNLFLNHVRCIIDLHTF